MVMPAVPRKSGLIVGRYAPGLAQLVEDVCSSGAERLVDGWEGCSTGGFGGRGRLLLWCCAGTTHALVCSR